MRVKDIPEKTTLTSAEISNAYVLGIKNIYPDDDISVGRLSRFPLSAFFSDIEPQATKQLIERLRNFQTYIAEQKNKTISLAKSVKNVTESDLSSGNFQTLSNAVSYSSVTSELANIFATPEEFQAAINSVYAELFKAVEEMMTNAFTTSMYARQYTQITDISTATIVN